MAIGILLFGSLMAATPVTASHNSRYEMLPYDLSLPLHAGTVSQLGLDLQATEPACDEAGLFAVRFCEALEGAHEWTRVWIDVWDHGNLAPIPIGAKYTFFGPNGGVVGQGSFCNHAQVKVPDNAEELFVEVAHVDSIGETTHNRPCGIAPFHGDVVLRWTSHSQAELGAPPADENESKCICECDCHPIFGCECECRPRDGHEDCDCKLQEEE